MIRDNSIFRPSQECTQTTSPHSVDKDSSSHNLIADTSVQKTTQPETESVNELSNIVYQLGTQISYLTQEGTSTRQEVDSLEAQLKRRNIEITGIPYRPNEKVNVIFSEICKLLDIDLVPTEHVHRVHRIKPFDNSNYRKSIIVELKDQHIRDTILSKAKLSNNLLLTNLGFQNSHLRVFVNEHLTHLKKNILFNLRRFKEDIRYDKLWVKGGQIYLKFPDRILNVANKEILSALLKSRES